MSYSVLFSAFLGHRWPIVGRAAVLCLALAAASACEVLARNAPPERLEGVITWVNNKALVPADGDTARTETETTTVTLDVVLVVTGSRNGVSLYEVAHGGWTAEGSGRVEEHRSGCTMTRDTRIALHGGFGSPRNSVTLLQNRPARTGLLSFSLAHGQGVVRTDTNYCDKQTVTQNSASYWSVSDVALEVTPERGADGVTRFVVSGERTGPCEGDLTCTRTASGVLEPVRATT